MMNKTSIGLSMGNAADKIRKLKEGSANLNMTSEGDQLVEVDLDLIDFDEEQYRDEEDQEDYDLEGLAKNIRETKLQQKPTYELKNDGRWLVLVGEMRTRAYMLNRERYPDEARWKKIPAIKRVVEPIAGLSDRATRDVIQLSENLFRDAGSVFKIADRLVKLEKEGGAALVKKLLADQGQKNSKVDLARWRAMAKVPVQIRRDVRKLKVKDKETIKLLANIADKSPSSYKDIIDGFENKTLPTSLANVVSATWRTVRETEENANSVPGDSIAAEVIKSTKRKPKKATQNEDVSTNLPDEVIELTLSYVASQISVQPNEIGSDLIIVDDQGKTISISLPHSVLVTVTENYGY